MKASLLTVVSKAEVENLIVLENPAQSRMYCAQKSFRREEEMRYGICKRDIVYLDFSHRTISAINT